MTTPVVGPGQFQNPTLKPNVKENPSKGNSVVSRIDQYLASQGYEFTSTAETEGLSFVDSMTSSQLATIAAMLKKRNYTIKASAKYVKNLFATEPELAAIAAKAGNDYNKLVATLSEDYLPGLGRETEPNLPSRQIYQYRDEDIDAIVSEAYKAAAMREPSPEELMAQRKVARAKLETGTLSVTKKVKNPKTGKLENVTTQTPGASKTEVQSDIESELKKMNPDDVDRKQRIDFASWLSQNAAGA